MRKLLATVLCVILTLSTAVCAFAYDSNKKYIKVNNQTGKITKMTAEEASAYEKELYDYTYKGSRSSSAFDGYTVYAPTDYVTRSELIDKLNTVVPRYNSAYVPMTTNTSTDRTYVDVEMALTMISKAFGNLPEPVGANKTMAPSDDEYGLDNENNGILQDEVMQNFINARVMPIYYQSSEYMSSLVSENDVDTIIAGIYSLYGSSPVDDFYSYVNKSFLDETELDENDYTSIKGTIYEMDSGNNDIIKGDIINIIKGDGYEEGSMEQKIKDFYDSKLNTQARNKIGNKPIQYYLDGVDNAATTQELSSFMLRYADKENFPYFGFSMTMDQDDHTKRILCIAPVQPMLQGMSATDDKKLTAMLKDYTTKLFILGGETDEQAQKDAELIMQLDKKLAKYAYYPSYQKLDIDIVQKYYKNINLKSVAAKLGYTVDGKIMVYNLEAIKVIGGYFDGNHDAELKAVAKFEQLINSGQYLSEDYEKLNNEFSDKMASYMSSYIDRIKAVYGYDNEEAAEETTELTTQATTELSEKEEEAVSEVMYYFRDYVDRIYCDKYLDEQTKQDVTDLTKQIIEVYRERLQGNEWLSDEVKAEAIKKLDNIKIVVGQNREQSTYLDNVVISNTDESGYYDNMAAIMRAQVKADSDRQYTDIDEDDIQLELYSADASYSPELNAIFIPAGILNAPIYDKDSSTEEKLGGIGVVIGHEISHAFDLNGSTRDENGNERNWWTDKDRERFEELCEKVAELHRGAEIVNGISSVYTVNEDVADLGGLACALELMSRLDKPNYKAFFENYASIFGFACNRDLLYGLSWMDTHSLGKVRVNYSLKCFDEFYTTYGVTKDDGMYIPENKRAKVW